MSPKSPRKRGVVVTEYKTLMKGEAFELQENNNFFLWEYNYSDTY